MKVFGVVFLTVLVGAAYWPLLLSGEWNEVCGEWDDRANFVENELVRTLSWASVAQMFRETRVNVYEPLGWLLKAAVQRGRGYVAAHAHRLASLGLHWVCSLHVFLGASSLVGDAEAGLLAASLWAAHPAHAEVVGWMSAQPYTLATLFVVLMLRTHLALVEAEIAGREASRARYAGPVLYALAVGTKAVAIPAVASIAALDIVLGVRKPLVASRHVAPYACVAAIAVPVTLRANALGHDPHADVVQLVGPQRVVKGLVSLWFCLGKISWPARLSPHYMLRLPLDPTETLLSAAATLVSALGALAAWSRDGGAALAVWLHVAASFLPSCGFVQHGMIQKGGDRYCYLPFLGLAPAIAVLWTKWATGRWARRAAMGAALVALATEAQLTAAQVRVWRNDHSLLAHALTLDPHDWRVLDTYAEVLLREGQPQQQQQGGGTPLDERIIDPRDFFKRALHTIELMDLAPNPKVLVFRGKILVLLGQTDDGCALFYRAKHEYPDSAMAHNNAAVCDLRHPELRDAQAAAFHRALDLSYRDEHRAAVAANLRGFEGWRHAGFRGRFDATLIY